MKPIFYQLTRATTASGAIVGPANRLLARYCPALLKSLSTFPPLRWQKAGRDKQSMLLLHACPCCLDTNAPSTPISSPAIYLSFLPIYFCPLTVNVSPPIFSLQVLLFSVSTYLNPTSAYPDLIFLSFSLFHSLFLTLSGHFLLIVGANYP
jgi:hypothetical protein